jgi:molybdopterin/thiamine biosynthesis adenylyltransferase
MPTPFDYKTAFSRNLGWVTEAEQEKLHASKIAIAGLGGVGGHHLVNLTRLGIGAFHVAEFDQVEIQNFNRQACAMISSLNHDKIDVMMAQARDINPELKITAFPEGLTPDNIDAFLNGVDLYVDGLDFFELDIRRMVFAACARKGIPAITVAPIGMGVAHLNFLPGHMTFDEYFDFLPHDTPGNFLKFLIGLSPTMVHMGYLIDKSRVDFIKQKVPSTPMGCYLSAGVAGVEALKILLGRGRVRSAPYTTQFDVFKGKFKTTNRRGGNRHWKSRLIYWIAKQTLKKTGPRVSHDTTTLANAPV